MKNRRAASGQKKPKYVEILISLLEKVPDKYRGAITRDLARLVEYYYFL